jgi:hypothetical protein
MVLMVLTALVENTNFFLRKSGSILHMMNVVEGPFDINSVKNTISKDYGDTMKATKVVEKNNGTRFKLNEILQDDTFPEF